MSLRYNVKDYEDIKTYIYFNPTKFNGVDTYKNNIKRAIETHCKIKVYPNTEDINPHSTYENLRDSIYRLMANSEYFCKGFLPKAVSSSIHYADAVVIVGSSIDVLPNGNIFSFALINFQRRLRKKSIYIPEICSHQYIKGAGEILMNQIDDIARNTDMTDIDLISVPSAITFYEKYGFTKDLEICKVDNLCPMSKKINKPNGGKRKNQTNKNKNKSRKNKKTRKYFISRRARDYTLKI